MSAQSGWYDAGVPGRQRWWDGAQWTAHEREMTPPPPIRLQPAASPHAAQIAEALPPMGWFPVAGTADVRWWDGAIWTPYRVRDGRVRSDAFAIEPGGTGLALGIAFITLAVAQLSTGSLIGQPFFGIAPVLFFISGVLQLVGAFQTNRLRKLPVPRTVPVFDPSTRPLPGEVESAGAGWYPVSGQVARWWTGTQWSWYVGQKFGVRPTHSGPRGYLISMIIGGVLACVGVLGVVLGITVAVAGGVVAATFLLVVGAIGVLAGGLILPLVHARRYTMILPTKAPPLR